MRKLTLVVVALVAVGCGGAKTPQEELVGNWLFSNADQSRGVDVTFSGDGSYVAATIALTSSTSANVQEERGVYSATSDRLTMTPQAWTCAGADAPSTVSYKFLNGDLVLSSPSGVASFVPNNGPGSSMSEALTLGCFDSTGTFTPRPLGPVN